MILLHPVSTRINSVANDDAECCAPVELVQIQDRLFCSWGEQGTGKDLASMNSAKCSLLTSVLPWLPPMIFANEPTLPRIE
jgi:hypothetical protein